MEQEKIISCFISGPRQSGKSFYLTELIQKIKKNYKNIVIFSPTAAFDDTWKQMKKNKHIVFDENYSETKLKNIMTFAEHQKRAGKSNRYLIILDDLTNEFSINKKNILNQFAFKSRHYGLDYIFVSHKYTSLSPLIRTNSKQCVFFKPTTTEEINKISEDLESISVPKTKLQDILNNLKRYQSLLIIKDPEADKIILS